MAVEKIFEYKTVKAFDGKVQKSLNVLLEAHKKGPRPYTYRWEKQQVPVLVIESKPVTCRVWFGADTVGGFLDCPALLRKLIPSGVEEKAREFIRATLADVGLIAADVG